MRLGVGAALVDGSLVPGDVEVARRLIERADVVDAYTINIVTGKPDPVLVKRFAGYGGQMLPPQYIKQVDWKTFAIKPVGTGPYRLAQWRRSSLIALDRNGRRALLCQLVQGPHRSGLQQSGPR